MNIEFAYQHLEALLALGWDMQSAEHYLRVQYNLTQGDWIKVIELMS